MKKLKICYIYTDWAFRPDKQYGGVGYYRAVKPAKFLKKFADVDVYGHDFTKIAKTPELIWKKIFTEYDCVVVKQVDNEIAAGIMLFFADYYKKPVILDLDDNFLEVRPDQPAYEVYYKGSQKRAIFQAVLGSVAGLITSTQPLADFYKDRIKQLHEASERSGKAYNKDLKVVVCPNCIDPADWIAPKTTRRKIIGYAGSITHNGDLALVMPSLAKLMKEHKDWYFEVLGGIKSEHVPEVFKDFDEETFRRVQIKGGTQSWKGYPELLRKQRWAVGLAPLIDDEFNKGKSHIKWMEYALAGIPTLASKVYPYSEPIQGTPTIIDGETGMLFTDSIDFEQRLCSLLENDKMRLELAHNARKSVLQNWSYKDHIEKWHEAIQTLCNSQTPPTSSDSSKPVNATPT